MAINKRNYVPGKFEDLNDVSLGVVSVTDEWFYFILDDYFKFEVSSILLTANTQPLVLDVDYELATDAKYTTIEAHYTGDTLYGMVKWLNASLIGEEVFLSGRNFGTMIDNEAFKKYIDDKISSLPPQEKTDWNETSPSSPKFLENKPLEFPPEAHTHPLAEITDNGEMAYEDDVVGATAKARINGSWVDIPAGAEAFLDLLDTPSSYTGKGGFSPIVKATEDGLNFVDLEPPYPGKAFTPLNNTWYKIFETNSTEVGPVKADIIIYSDSEMKNPINLLRVNSTGIEAEAPVLDVYVRTQTGSSDNYGSVEILSNLDNNILRLYVKFSPQIVANLSTVEIYGRRTSDLIEEADPYIQPIVETPSSSHSAVYTAVINALGVASYKMHNTYMRGNTPINDFDYANKKYVDDNSGGGSTVSERSFTVKRLGDLTNGDGKMLDQTGNFTNSAVPFIVSNSTGVGVEKMKIIMGYGSFDWDAHFTLDLWFIPDSYLDEDGDQALTPSRVKAIGTKITTIERQYVGNEGLGGQQNRVFSKDVNVSVSTAGGFVVLYEFLNNVHGSDFFATVIYKNNPTS